MYFFEAIANVVRDSVRSSISNALEWVLYDADTDSESSRGKHGHDADGARCTSVADYQDNEVHRRSADERRSRDSELPRVAINGLDTVYQPGELGIRETLVGGDGGSVRPHLEPGPLMLVMLDGPLAGIRAQADARPMFIAMQPVDDYGDVCDGERVVYQLRNIHREYCVYVYRTTYDQQVMESGH